jgi:hypothetical protein
MAVYARQPFYTEDFSIMKKTSLGATTSDTGSSRNLFNRSYGVPNVNVDDVNLASQHATATFSSRAA